MVSQQRTIRLGFLLVLFVAFLPDLRVFARDQEPDTTPPTTTGVNVSPDPSTTNPTLTATASDTESAIRAVEFFVDVDPGVGLGTPMSAVDGAFDELTEQITGVIDISGLSSGAHRVFVRAQDSFGNVDPNPAFVDFTVGAPDTTPPTTTSIVVSPSPTTTNPTVTATSSDTESAIRGVEFFVDIDPGVGLATPMSAVDGAFDELTEQVTGVIDISGLSDGTHRVFVRATDVVGNVDPSPGFFVFEAGEARPEDRVQQALDALLLDLAAVLETIDRSSPDRLTEALDAKLDTLSEGSSIVVNEIRQLDSNRCFDRFLRDLERQLRRLQRKARGARRQFDRKTTNLETRSSRKIQKIVVKNERKNAEPDLPTGELSGNGREDELGDIFEEKEEEGAELLDTFNSDLSEAIADFIEEIEDSLVDHVPNAEIADTVLSITTIYSEFVDEVVNFPFFGTKTDFAGNDAKLDCGYGTIRWVRKKGTPNTLTQEVLDSDGKTVVSSTPLTSQGSKEEPCPKEGDADNKAKVEVFCAEVPGPRADDKLEKGAKTRFPESYIGCLKSFVVCGCCECKITQIWTKLELTGPGITDKLELDADFTKAGSEPMIDGIEDKCPQEDMPAKKFPKPCMTKIKGVENSCIYSDWPYLKAFPGTLRTTPCTELKIGEIYTLKATLETFVFCLCDGKKKLLFAIEWSFESKYKVAKESADLLGSADCKPIIIRHPGGTGDNKLETDETKPGSAKRLKEARENGEFKLSNLRDIPE